MKNRKLKKHKSKIINLSTLIADDLFSVVVVLLDVAPVDMVLRGVVVTVVVVLAVVVVVVVVEPLPMIPIIHTK